MIRAAPLTRAERWTRLEASTWPLLFTGSALAFLACALLPFTIQGSAALCIAAAAASMLGVTVAWRIDAEATPRGLLVPLALLSVLGAVGALRRREL